MSDACKPLPPGPRGWPLIGSLPAFVRDPLAFVDRTAATWGDVVPFRLGGYPMLLLIDPDLIDEALVKSWRSMHKDAIYQFLLPLLGQGLVTNEDEPWKRQRQLIAPFFTPRHLRVYGEQMAGATERYAAALVDGEERDLRHDFMQLTLQIVLETLFGSDLGTGEGDVDPAVVERCTSTFMSTFMPESHSLLPKFVPTPTRARVRRAIALLDDVILGLIAARRRSGAAHDDLLGRLLAATDEAGRGMDDRQLRDEVITLFMAGHETTANALTFTTVLLSRHPEARDRMHAEVDAAVGERLPTVDDLPRLPYTKAVLLEGMRLYPPVWAVGREAMADVRIGPYDVAKGTQLLFCPWVNHRQARWFEEPHAFRPERWLGDLEKRLPRFAYYPFGGGPRVCVGNHFAMMEGQLVLATLARHAALTWTGTPDLALEASVTLRPKVAVRAVVARRTVSSRRLPEAAHTGA